jgi:starch-binding outer membrane protein SusE/F
MKTKLLLLIALIFSAININAQITSVAVVGEAAGGWPGQPGNPGPTDVHQMTSTDGENWTLSGLTLTTFAPDGGIKFRANNDWTINWGSEAFPSGTGTQGGANIKCIAGTYDVTFNSTTGEYNFSGGTPLPVVKLVGTAVTEPGGLVLNISGPDTFSVSNSTLVEGFAQFEVDGVLYGGTSFPTGSAISETDQIPVPAAFFSSISINIASGEYTFIQIPPVSIVGDGVGGWPESVGNPGPIDVNQLSSTDGINYKLDKLACVVGPAKFRQDNAWTINWGNAAFPSGTATQGGDNIAITAAATYDVKFNRVTGDYSFTIPSIALVGQATPTGWPTGTPGEVDASALTTTDGVTYTLTNVALSVGECKFRANNSWDVNWGAADFPSGTATQGGANIAIATADNYDVTLNRVTGAYNFTPSLSVNQFGINAVSVYPNPTASNFSIKGNFEKAQVYNISGQLVKTFVSSDNNQFSISDLSSGLYLVRVSDANNNYKTLKLVKE